jgi:hypothetical protein
MLRDVQSSLKPSYCATILGGQLQTIWIATRISPAPASTG